MRSRRAIGLLVLAAALCAFFVVGRDRAWWAGEEVERAEEAREALPPRAEPPATGGADATLQGTGTEDAAPTPEAAPARKLPAQEGTLAFHYQQGWSFERSEVVPAAEADLVFESCAGGIASVTLRVPGGGIVNASGLRSEVHDVKTARALYDAVVRGHPDALHLAERARGDVRVPAHDLFLARTRRGEWLELAIVDRATTGGWTTRLVTIAYRLEPDEPVFRDGTGDVVQAGFELDLSIAVARDTEVQAEIARSEAERERPVRERLARLDERALQLETALRGRGDDERRVAGVLVRRFARELGSPHAYRDATYSFEHVTRDASDDVTRNDWDFVVDRSRDGLTLRVCTVSDDRSLIVDLGALGFEAALRGEFPPGEGAEQARAVVGHLYLLHTLDTETDHWILLRVLEITEGEDLLFEWVRVEDPDPLRHAFGGGELDLRRGYARLQVRSDHGGGNPHRAFLDGSKGAYVDELSPVPLDLSEPVRREARGSAAYVEGGLVPHGMVFLVESVGVRIDVDGNERPRVDSLLRVGPYPLVWIEDDRRPGHGPEPGWLVFVADRGIERVGRDGLHLERRLAVRIPIRRDDEKHVFVAGASFTRSDVVLEGRLVAEADAPQAPALPGILYHVRHRLNGLLLREDAEEAVSRLQREPGLLPWLRGLRDLAGTGPYRSRLDLAVRHLETQLPTDEDR